MDTAGIRYRYLNHGTMQALFVMSEDCLPAYRATGSSSLALADELVNTRGSGMLYRLFNEAVQKENALDPD